MTMKQKNIKLVEEIINGNNAARGELQLGNSKEEVYQYHTIIRLIKAFDRFQKNEITLNDFLIPLRDYLIIFETEISLNQIKIPEDNLLGIKRDRIKKTYYAVLDLPTGVESEFINKVFLRNWSESHKTDKYNLYTDPLIYSITGFKTFKTLSQKLAVYGSLNTPSGYTSLISLPTGGGKSLITQLMGYKENGLTIVVVPTVSLALDQMISAKKNIKTRKEGEIFSYSSGDQIGPILESIEKRKARLLFISPEALMNNTRFGEVIEKANRTRYLKNIVIDEAHIVVDWGADFRVDYQCLEAWRKDLLLTNPQIRTILLSATFEERSVNILKNAFCSNEKWIEIRCDALRHEPRFILLNEKRFGLKKKKALELIQKLPHPMIVYFSRPDETEMYRKFLKEELGIENVRTYNGQTKRSKRKEVLEDWKNDEFSIILATSAFGVGVDKPDVRTVLHLNIPENPNAYYQELGRGGRDQLPSLSVMCYTADDLNAAYQRITKKVMTTEKIIERWRSMYNNPHSIRDESRVHIDTAIRPNYREEDVWDDGLTSDADIRWNIYVLLLLRRYSMIDIKTIMNDQHKYTVTIEIKDNRLMRINSSLSEKIEAIREEEWNWYKASFNEMKNNITDEKSCLSEMFFNTYEYVDEYCAGCREHLKIHNSEYNSFPLKNKTLGPAKSITCEQEYFLEHKKEMIVECYNEPINLVIEKLMEKELSCVIDFDNMMLKAAFVKESRIKKSIFLIGKQELEGLKSRDDYYISGLIAVVYPKQEDRIIHIFDKIQQMKKTRSDLRIIHVLSKDPYLSVNGRRLSDLIDGSIIRSEDIR